MHTKSNIDIQQLHIRKCVTLNGQSRRRTRIPESINYNAIWHCWHRADGDMKVQSMYGSLFVEMMLLAGLQLLRCPQISCGHESIEHKCQATAQAPITHPHIKVVNRLNAQAHHSNVRVTNKRKACTNVLY